MNMRIREEKDMQRKILRKGLVVGIIILFIGVGVLSSVSTATDIFINRNTNNKNDPSPGSWNKGIVIFHTVKKDFMMPECYYPDPWRELTCEDLDTGEIRHIVTNWFGFRVRFFLRGHDYKIHLEGTTLDILIEELKFYNYARFETPMPIHSSIILVN
jgi:hypothetical protein